MAYQVLARKWRPQRFEDVIGQGGVTRTLQNAIRSGRLAQAFVFAGPRGVGKTTSARIFARALNCTRAEGPTPEPCGVCEPCVEIAEGRDMDVLEIDAATHTQVEKVRDVIVSSLMVPPVRDRYKAFIIDEVHQLSGHSFNALLKSIEEPPPHVVFMMATTELQKIPETILSRSQVHEFRTIPERAIAGQLRTIATAEGIEVDDAALALLARAADGSMRDGLTAFDQVLAFAGGAVTVDDVSSVLGLVGRDLLLDIVTAVADETAPAAFELAARAAEGGYDLKLLCRELSRLVRDLMLVSVDRRRLDDPEVVPAGERARIEQVAGRFSREDLLRAFDLIARTESEIRTAAEPRYHLEMALLKWIHLRKLVPLEDLLLGAAGSSPLSPGPSGSAPAAVRPRGPIQQGTVSGPTRRAAATAAQERPQAGLSGAPPSTASATEIASPATSPTSAVRPRVGSAASSLPAAQHAPGEFTADENEDVLPEQGGRGLKEALLSEIRRAKAGFYRMNLAQAAGIDVEGDRVVFSFPADQAFAKSQVEQARSWLESTASKIAGRKIQVVATTVTAASNPRDPEAPGAPAKKAAAEPGLKAEAASDPDMKMLLEILPLEIRTVEKLDP